jgi:hypothetical protein
MVVGTGSLCLAEKAGIVISSVGLEEVATKPVLLLRRFDREGARRVPFL